jgi:glycerol-3-phosphate O-acyltransferase
MSLHPRIQQAEQTGTLSRPLAHTVAHFYDNYRATVQNSHSDLASLEKDFEHFLTFVIEQSTNPHPFESYHAKVRQPIDYFQFGIDFMRPLLAKERSQVIGLEHVQAMTQALARGENVVLLSNHQSEADPQFISLLLEDTFPEFAEEIIFVAGARVLTDPMAVPMSLGRNLLCIYSKRHIEHPPEEKEAKLLHNQKTMKRMSQLMAEGGKTIYVAPSGGRDRMDDQGKIPIAPFDPQSLEMFFLMARQAGKPTHFYPFALWTYPLLPPPRTVQKDLGEERITHHAPAGLAFGPEIDIEEYPGKADPDKRARRQHRSDYIYKLVTQEYDKIKELK